MNATRSGVRHSGSPRGFTLAEILVIVAVIGILAAIAVPNAAKFIRRARDMSALSTITRELNKARLLSIQRGFNVCVKFGTISASTDPTKQNQIRMLVWEDRNPDFALGTWTDPSGGTPNEVVLGPGTPAPAPTLDINKLQWVMVSQAIHLGGKQPSSTPDDLPTNVLFNGYSGGDALVVFTPTGALVSPPCCKAADIKTTEGRGIYFQDSAGKNFFRITIYSDLTGKPREEMYVNGGYSPTNWVWQ